MSRDLQRHLVRAGNLTSDGSNSYTYDAENRLVSFNGSAATYAYGPDSLRVKRVQGGVTTRYVFSGFKVIAEYTGATPALAREYIYAGDQMLARVTPGSPETVTYRHLDHLSARVETNSSGTAVRSFGHYPYGETWYESGTADKWKFTTYERDTPEELDYAIYRSYVPRLARFLTPDLLAGQTGNPASLNRYAYVVSDPVNLTDPTGLDPAVCFYASPAFGIPPMFTCSLGGSGGGGGGGLVAHNDYLWLQYWSAANSNFQGGQGWQAMVYQGWMVEHEMPGYHNPAAQAEADYAFRVFEAWQLSQDEGLGFPVFAFTNDPEYDRCIEAANQWHTQQLQILSLHATADLMWRAAIGGAVGGALRGFGRFVGTGHPVVFFGTAVVGAATGAVSSMWSTSERLMPINEAYMRKAMNCSQKRLRPKPE